MVDDTNVSNVVNVAGTPDVTRNQDPTNGRFLPGNKLGVGRMVQSRMSQYRKAMFAAVSDDDMQAVARSMVTLAIQGDVAAAKLIWDQCLGKVPEAEVEVDASSTPGQLVINLVSPNAKN